MYGGNSINGFAGRRRQGIYRRCRNADAPGESDAQCDTGYLGRRGHNVAMYRNTVYKLVITLAETENNYPPFEIFRKLCTELVLQGKISSEDRLARLSRFWALLHGTVALIVSPEVDMKNIILTGDRPTGRLHVGRDASYP